MFNYFRNGSSNAFHVGCEDSPTKGLKERTEQAVIAWGDWYKDYIGIYNISSVWWPWPSFKVILVSQTWQMYYLYYNSNISDNI